MLDIVHTRWRVLLLGICAALTVPAAAVGLPREATGHAPATAAAASANGCPGAAARAARVGRARLRAALLCLVNRERAKRGVRPLRHDRRLVRAATRHARDMVRRRYFAHQRAGGPDLGARLARARWRGSAAGETIAYGCGAGGSARETVRRWMASPGHNAILLSGSYGRGGPAVAKRAPVHCRGGATWVLDVGRR